MALILHIETSTEVCSVALSEGGQLLLEKEAADDYSHASQLTLLIRDLMASAERLLKDLDAVSVSSGPGSFTGLRVGTAAAKGICYALDKPLIAVDTLLSLAGGLALLNKDSAKASKDSWFCPMIDARRMEVYTAVYKPDLSVAEEKKALIVDETSFSDYVEKGIHLMFGGNGAAKCEEVLEDDHFHFVELSCAARHLIPFADAAFAESRFEDLASFSPEYLKRPNITRSKKGRLFG
ncbi:MAG: tRNA (adenosine(37)-N6)-threonylcarbamoyltransferase complex dimerization subunit type 1 TsaB [Bacteroidetes bacterium]|nr:tRNA (adenosine(37)-N6)-threonylcarbamoyltransferase complex dimerization subunit type 1 TsaB [Bacteroidota bacterium]